MKIIISLIISLFITLPLLAANNPNGLPDKKIICGNKERPGSIVNGQFWSMALRYRKSNAVDYRTVSDIMENKFSELCKTGTDAKTILFDLADTCSASCKQYVKDVNECMKICDEDHFASWNYVRGVMDAQEDCKSTRNNQ